jgi:MFS transporter, DHA1 family, multidrug resistance protein
MVATFGLALFMMAVATAKDIQTIIICRFWASIFASAPLTITGGLLADIYDFAQRGTAVASVLALVFVGPVIAPIIGAFITESPSSVSWSIHENPNGSGGTH